MLAATQVVGRGSRAVAVMATAPPFSTSLTGGQLIPLQQQQGTHLDFAPACQQRRSAILVFANAMAKSSRQYSSGAAPLHKVVGCDTFDFWKSRRDLQPCRSALHEDGGPIEAVAEVIDGKAIAKDIRASIAKEVAHMKDKVGKVPGLAVVLVGNRTDSATYVRSKKKACEEAGIGNFGTTLPDDTTEEEVLGSVRKFNSDPAVHGILVQLPLPKHISEDKVLGAIDVEKDVDGFHPLNVGRLALQGRTPLHVSCTPRGCIELLLRSGVTMKGKHAVVIGRSYVVGMPVAILLQRQNATVTIVHSHTPNPAEVTRGADIVIVAIGVAHLVRGDWIKPGAVVIDVGMNSVDDSTAKKGYRLVGDVCYEETSQVASKITPVPGGVGPMTIAMLLSNTLDSAKRAFGLTDNDEGNNLLLSARPHTGHLKGYLGPEGYEEY